jgi:hypothetical protein
MPQEKASEVDATVEVRKPAVIACRRSASGIEPGDLFSRLIFFYFMIFFRQYGEVILSILLPP